MDQPFRRSPLPEQAEADIIVNEGFPGEYDDELSSVGTAQSETIISSGGDGHDDLEAFGEDGNDSIILDGGQGDDALYLNTGDGSDQATVLGGQGGKKKASLSSILGLVYSGEVSFYFLFLKWHGQIIFR